MKFDLIRQYIEGFKAESPERFKKLQWLFAILTLLVAIGTFFKEKWMPSALEDIFTWVNVAWLAGAVFCSRLPAADNSVIQKTKETDKTT